MRFISNALPLLVLGYSSLGLADSVRYPRWRRALNETDQQQPSDATPNRYIVELSSRLQSTRLANKITAGVPSLRVVKHFDSDLFPAVSVECAQQHQGCDAESLISSFGEEGTVKVYKSAPVRILPVAEEGESFSDDAAAANYSVHGLTGVAQLHEDGVFGEGATVAIVDSGVQYTHPALGGGIGPGYTVIGGYDLVGDGEILIGVMSSDWPDTPPKPDDDPMDHYGHGTHVAGIIAGKSDQFVGVAPSAKLLSFKVFSTDGYSDEEIVIEGFLKAFDSGADIITASLGETSGFTSNAWAVVASRMVEQGVVVTIAAGNDGQHGPFDASNGASGQSVLTIASAEPGVFPAQAFTTDFILDGSSNKTEVAYIPASGYFPSTIADWPIVPVTLNSSVENDACTALPDETPSFNGTIVLVRVGGCTVTVKQNNLAPFGASYILFYNDDGPFVSPITGNTATGSGLTGAIESNAGEAIISTILAGGNVTASFDVDTAHYVGLHNAGGGRPALYTSWGGTYDLALKPDVAAPGTKILSTYPTDAYQVLSGTSMATPYIAGVAALWVGKFGGRAAHKDDPAWAKRLTARIMSTAKTVPWADWATSPTDYGFWAPTTQVGAGLVDAERVLGYTTQLSFDGRKFELNDTANFVGTHSVEITNMGTEAVTYEFALQDAAGYDAYTPSVPGKQQSFIPSINLYVELSPVKMAPGVVMPQGEFVVGAGETKTAEFTFTVPAGLNASNLPVYSGKILASGSNGEELSIPYFGVACDLKETIENNWDYGSNFPYITSGLFSVKLENKANFTFNLSRDAQDFPKLSAQFAWGTEELRWDIFDANYTESAWTYPPVPGQNGFVGSATSWNGTATTNWFDPSIASEDDIFSFPLYARPRRRMDRYYWLGRFADGSDIVPGVYNFRIAALKPFGEPKVAEDWDIWETPQITVLPLN
ncbi:peptidase S8/S53 domain-containing protein [Pseudomassariella vexata]|uniref:Peptidase S8/S53 domain-containing protein n=1 Tax=Pseudomassariella vexata TaxID=1141098 RepID=A0A1Y2EFA2_9PEZI|nr:peptidase S8/S53 domain-containing protein [Pseudomassariella vexata]ORY70252.1 peptidase S8/S53 domain-containing protein [Pseudomassariella vexata]